MIDHSESWRAPSDDDRVDSSGATVTAARDAAVGASSCRLYDGSRCTRAVGVETLDDDDGVWSGIDAVLDDDESPSPPPLRRLLLLLLQTGALLGSSAPSSPTTSAPPRCCSGAAGLPSPPPPPDPAS